MAFREGGDTDGEVTDLLHHLDQLERVVEVGRVGPTVERRIATEGEDVVEAGVAVTGDDVDDLGAAVGDARQVRHRGHRGIARDVLHDAARGVARRPSGAVGHRDEGRLQRLELEQRLLQALLGFGRARRAELERVGRARRQEIGDAGHVAAFRSAISTVFRSKRATVVGPTPPRRGVIQPATSATDSSTSGSSFLPSNTMPPLTTAAPGRTMSGWTMPGTPAAPITMSP